MFEKKKKNELVVRNAILSTLEIFGGWGHQVESSVVRVGRVGAGAGTKSRAWGLEENFIAGVDLEGPEEYLTYLVSNDTQQSTGGKWDMWPNNEPIVLSP